METGFLLGLAYLADIFQALNSLNLLLQVKNTNRINEHDAIRAFVVKLGRWHHQVQQGNTQWLDSAGSN